MKEETVKNIISLSLLLTHTRAKIFLKRLLYGWKDINLD